MQLNRKQNRIALLVVTSISLAVLSACGGGNEACSTQEALTITGTAYPERKVETPVGVAISPLTPALAGIPASCLGAKRFEVSASLAQLPRGITLDAVSGTISGTPTEATPFKIVNGTQIPVPSYSRIVLQLPGYGPVQIGIVEFFVTK